MKNKVVAVEILRPHSRCSIFAQKRKETSVFVKVFTLIRRKTLQKLRFSKMLLKVDIRKTGDFWKHSNVRYWVSQKKNGSMWTHKNEYCLLRFGYQADQYERIKTDIFGCVFVQNGVIWTGVEQVLTKGKYCEQDLTGFIYRRDSFHFRQDSCFKQLAFSSLSVQEVWS